MTQTGSGCLVLVGTPIGNMGDLSPRASDALAQADVVCAEDTRVTAKLLAAAGIEARLERCDENIIAQKTPELIERILAGKNVVLVSDAGMPAVADPGARLVDACLDAGVRVDVIPGPSAVTTAIAHAGFTKAAFYFGGFLPRRDAERMRVFESLANLDAVLVFYESPHRVHDSLRVAAQVFPQRRCALVRELTKVHQEVIRDFVPELLAHVEARDEIKGEVVLVFDAPSAEELHQRAQGDAVFEQEVLVGIEAGEKVTTLAKKLAAQFGISKSQAYDRILELQESLSAEHL